MPLNLFSYQPPTPLLQILSQSPPLPSPPLFSPSLFFLPYFSSLSFPPLSLFSLLSLPSSPQHMTEMYGKLHTAFRKVVDIMATGKRYLGTYFRVAFFGKVGQHCTLFYLPPFPFSLLSLSPFILLHNVEVLQQAVVFPSSPNSSSPTSSSSFLSSFPLSHLILSLSPSPHLSLLFLFFLLSLQTFISPSSSPAIWRRP